MIIIMLLALPVLIKLFTNLTILKLKAVPKKCLDAQVIVDQINKKKIRPLKVEKKYNVVCSEFNNKLKHRELSRKQILAIRSYLEASVNKYEHKHFENDAQAIYAMLKAKDINTRDLSVVNFLIS